MLALPLPLPLPPLPGPLPDSCLTARVVSKLTRGTLRRSTVWSTSFGISATGTTPGAMPATPTIRAGSSYAHKQSQKMENQYESIETPCDTAVHSEFTRNLSLDVSYGYILTDCLCCRTITAGLCRTHCGGPPPPSAHTQSAVACGLLLDFDSFCCILVRDK